MKLQFKKAVIVGPGLIGGSIGLHLRKDAIADFVIGVARHSATLKKAKSKGSIDEGSFDVKKSVTGADLIILAAPVEAIKNIIKEIKDVVNRDCVVFDVASTKREIVETAERFFKPGVLFAGAHPMAGSEKAGAEFACYGLFKKTICFITKTDKTDKKALLRVKALWNCFGATPVVISASLHDVIVARVSHLPHLMSVVLVDAVEEKFLNYAASGFRDTTRIASGAPDLWKDISFSNKRALLESIDMFEKKLNCLKNFLKNDDERMLVKMLARAKRKRDKL